MDQKIANFNIRENTTGFLANVFVNQTDVSTQAEAFQHHEGFARQNLRFNRYVFNIAFNQTMLFQDNGIGHIHPVN